VKRVLLAALALLGAAAALAYVPPAGRIAASVADANRLHGRAQPLALTVVVRGEGDVQLATGTLLSDPRGVARLELTHSTGFVERQLRRAKSLEASRDRERLPDPHPLLPPLWLLQASPGATLQTRIAELGGDPDAVALGFDGDHDCFVLGGRTAEASYWLDQESFAPVRIDLPGGVRYRLGPPVAGGGIELPAWITLEAPGGRDALAIRRALQSAPGWCARAQLLGRRGRGPGLFLRSLRARGRGLASLAPCVASRTPGRGVGFRCRS
jgi:hypothetical protein